MELIHLDTQSDFFYLTANKLTTNKTFLFNSWIFWLHKIQVFYKQITLNNLNQINSNVIVDTLLLMLFLTCYNWYDIVDMIVFISFYNQ